MSIKLVCSSVTWDKLKNEICFLGAYISNGQKKYEVSGIKRIVPKDSCLYLCKVDIFVGKHKDYTFKFAVLRGNQLDNFSKDDIQLVGKNRNGTFVYDEKFFQGLKMSNNVINNFDYARKDR